MTTFLAPPSTASRTIAEHAEMAGRLRRHLMEAHPGCAVGSEGGSDAAGAGGCVVPRALVDIRRAAPEVVLLPSPPWSDPELRFLVRPEVAERLRRAALTLPSDLRLGFWEGLRPLAVQRELWSSGLEFLRGAYPHAAGEELEEVLEQYVARPDLARPPHSTGSAVDVAAVDAFGQVLDPGTAWGRLGTEGMARALREAGLVNYAPEWWHWSYGDEEWARANDCAPLSFASDPEFEGSGDGI